MKIACLQFAPELGKVEENIRRAEAILKQTALPADLDWLILPEMAFSGYNFHSLEEITSFLEPTTSGITTQWAIQVAAHYKCHVTVGYPEITTDSPPIRYNSTVTVSPQGTVLNNYRKTFLYYTDETWASEGDSRDFFSGPLGDLGDVTLGICMDINPYQFVAPWDSYEFANAALSARTPITCISMAWLCTLSPEELMEDPTQADFATVAYWVERFQPFVEKSVESGLEGPWYVLLANRCGTEKGVCYAGSTTVLKIERGGVSLYDTLGKAEEGCLVVDTREKPKFQIKDDRLLGRTQKRVKGRYKGYVRGIVEGISSPFGFLNGHFHGSLGVLNSMTLKGPVNVDYRGQTCGSFKGMIVGWFDGVIDARLIIECAVAMRYGSGISHSSNNSQIQ